MAVNFLPKRPLPVQTGLQAVCGWGFLVPLYCHFPGKAAEQNGAFGKDSFRLSASGIPHIRTLGVCDVYLVSRETASAAARCGDSPLCGILGEARRGTRWFDQRGLKVPLTVLCDVWCVRGWHSHESRCAVESEVFERARCSPT